MGLKRIRVPRRGAAPLFVRAARLLLEYFFYLADFLLDFSSELFILAFGFEVGIFCHSTGHFFNFTFHFVGIALCLIAGALLHVVSPLEHIISALWARKIVSGATQGQASPVGRARQYGEMRMGVEV